LVFLVMLPNLFYVTMQEPYKLPMILWKHELTKHVSVDAFFTTSHCHQKTSALWYVLSELQLDWLFH
jgi:hypothetical protein